MSDTRGHNASSFPIGTAVKPTCDGGYNHEVPVGKAPKRNVAEAEQHAGKDLRLGGVADGFDKQVLENPAEEELLEQCDPQQYDPETHQHVKWILPRLSLDRLVIKQAKCH